MSQKKHKIKTWQLRQRQGLSLEAKIELTKLRIREFYERFGGLVYVAFSGGKDSTVLLHIVRSMYPDVPAVFVDTGLEYPEIKDFVRTVENVTWIRPVMGFHKVIDEFGYPVLSKDLSHSISQAQRHGEGSSLYKLRMTGIGKDGEYHGASVIPEKWQYLVHSDVKISDKCCDIIKKNPNKVYEKETGRKPILGLMASDSMGRRMNYLEHGCNAFEAQRVQSRPLGFWLEEDIWNYIKMYDLEYSKIYDMGEERTGCIFCMFGIHMEEVPNRFQRLAKTHPKQYKFCMEKLGLREVLELLKIPHSPPRTLESFSEDD